MATLFGTITDQDMINAQAYATNKLLREKVLAYAKANPNTINWLDKDPSGSVSYRCPKGLTCYEGTAVIANQTECESKNAYSDTIIPDSKTGWPLFWGQDKQCHFSNYMYHQDCNTKLSKKGKLNWDDGTQQCYITRSYCKNNGFDEYSPGKGIPGKGGDDGGTCDLSFGMTVSDALFGDTISRGVFKEACFK